MCKDRKVRLGISIKCLFVTDIVFDPELIPDLVGLITDFLEARAGIAILACTIRNEATMEVLRKTLGIFF